MPCGNVFSWLRRVPGIFVARVMTRPLPTGPACALAQGELAYRLLSQEELLDACTDPELELDAAKVGAASARGDYCVGVFDARRLVGYLWVGFSATPLTGHIWVGIPAGATYAYKAFLRKDQRGRGIGNEFFVRAAAVCPREGRTVGITFILVDNRPSILAAQKSGWRTVGYAGYLAKGALFAAFRSPGAWRASFRFYRAARLKRDRSTRAGALASLR